MRPGRLLKTSGLLPALAVAAGALDAASYLGLGRVFTANMTGNTVLLGVAVASGSAGSALRSVVALAGFCAGVALGSAFTASREDWPRPARGALAAESLVLAGLLGVWVLAGPTSTGVRYALIALSAGAMGIQSAAARAAPLDGVATTFITGTLTNAVGRAVKVIGSRAGERPRSGEIVLPGVIWLIYGAGGLAGAMAQRWLSPWAAVIPLAIVSAVAAIAAR